MNRHWLSWISGASRTVLAAAIVAAGTCAAMGASMAAAQSRTVAITIDDLPFVTGSDAPKGPQDAPAAIAANRKLLNALARHRVPVTGFVNEKKVEQLGTPAGTEILKSWVASGLDLGNHSYAHLDFNDLTVEQFEDEIIRGETTIVPLMQAAGRKVEFFRFPFNHAGDTEAKHSAMMEFLVRRGYRLAPCTIETSDYIFAAAYQRMAASHDHSSQARLRREYLTFTAAQIDYFSHMNAEVLGYEPPEIVLLHDNQLNADVMNQILNLYEKRGYKWVSLAEAERDPVYQAPDTFITKYGPMWGYRWARERGTKVDGSKEPEPPAWIATYGNAQVTARRPRGSF
ncbi:MAG: polysaccharide deacetylase family protein [Terracidiphilus sp.]